MSSIAKLLFGRDKSSTKQTPEVQTSEHQSKDTNTFSCSNDFNEVKRRLLALKTEANKAYVQSLNKRFKNIRSSIRNWDHVYNSETYDVSMMRDLYIWNSFFPRIISNYCEFKLVEQEVSKFVKSLNEEGFKASYEANQYNKFYRITVKIETES